MSKIIIFGAGRGAQVAYKYFTEDSAHEVCAFTVDKQFMHDKVFMGLPVVPFEELEKHYPPNEFKMFMLMDYDRMNLTRKEKFLQGKDKGYDFESYISSDIHALETPPVGENCFIMEGQTINLDVKIGDNVVLWSGNHIGDSTIIEDHVWFSSHVCIGGDCTIGETAFLGNNCTITNNIIIGKGCFVGSGALITKHTEDEGVYTSSPAEKSPMDSKRFIQLVHMHCAQR